MLEFHLVVGVGPAIGVIGGILVEFGLVTISVVAVGAFNHVLNHLHFDVGDDVPSGNGAGRESNVHGMGRVRWQIYSFYASPPIRLQFDETFIYGQFKPDSIKPVSPLD